MSTSVPSDMPAQPYERRWWMLAVLCLSLFVIVLDNSILNVALPTIVRELDATNSQLQWMVDSYTLVFAGLLLTAGAMGDRFGRRGALQVGFVIFGLGSLASALADTANQLIATRAFMGIGGAFIMPATLSIITNVFPPNERGRAIGIWAGVAGLAVLGPLAGGVLVENFFWGSIFLVNLPVVALGLVAGAFLIPTSKDPAARRLDPVGAVLSIAGLSALLYGIIEAPEAGWSDGTILLAFALGALLLAGFFAWEARVDHPMLDLAFFRNPRFTAASLVLSLIFFAMLGSIFLFTQYFQFVLGYSALRSGVALLPWAVTMAILAPNSPRLVERVGTKVVVTTGLVLMTLGLAAMAGVDASTSYANIVWRMILMASGMGLTMAPATESIMGSLPLGKAGVGSAVNDTTRQVGGALGVAIVGSVAASIYASDVSDAVAQSPPDVTHAVKDQIGAALQVAERLDVPQLASAARDAFVDGMQAGVLVAAGATLLGALLAFLWLPARARDEHEGRGGDEIAAGRAGAGPAAVVFDLDGVLVDSEQVWARVRHRYSLDHGGRWSEHAETDMMGMSSTEWSRYMHDRLDVHVPPEKISEDVAGLIAAEYEREVPLLPGAVEVVERLAARWPLGLASSANRSVIDLVLERTGLGSRFSATVSSEEVARGKPAPDVYLEVASRLGVDARASAAVEDSANGIRSAATAGMRVFALPNPHYPPGADALAHADVVLDRLTDLEPDGVEPAR